MAVQPIVKTGSNLNINATEKLIEHPYFTVKCKLSTLLKNRGMTLKELSYLTGIRVATLSEMANIKRTTINVPHMLVIAKTLRLLDIGELFEFVMPEDTFEQFNKDRFEIGRSGLLPEQQEKLTNIQKAIKDHLERTGEIG